MKKMIGMIALLLLMMGGSVATEKQSISTFLLKLDKLKISKCTTILEYLYQRKRK